jgi:xanthine dehydrogenase accessory factor
MAATAVSKTFLDRFCLFLERGDPFALLTVIDRSGSGPREAGTMMIVDGEGQSFGTVGGGVLEAQAKKLAEKVISASRSALESYSLTNRDASDLGMICGGRMEILVDYIAGGDPQWLAVVKHLADARRRRQEASLIRSIRKEGDRVYTGVGIADQAGFAVSSLDLSQFDREIVTTGSVRMKARLYERNGVRYFIQPAEVPGTVFIFGAGHVGEALAPLCHFVGFRTVIIDDRVEFANKERFPVADEIHVPESFEAFFSGLDLTESDCAVIVTRGHASDQGVLMKALGTAAGYIGMIASRRKRDIVYRNLIESGYSEQDLARIHSPIGLDIGAETPEEIAVSIVSELIAVRAGRSARKAGSSL